MISEPSHILVVDDDKRLLNLLQRFLRKSGFTVSTANNAQEARAKLVNLMFDMLVVDVMMPGQSGIEFLRELRGNNDVPVLLLTAKGDTEDRISGLEAGADDYMSKPFEPRELLLRINGILKRSSKKQQSGKRIHFGPFLFDAETEELFRDDERINLTTGEASLLSILASRPGEAVSRSELTELGRVSGSDRAVDVQMTRLRRKLEEDPRQPQYIITLRGEGYILRIGRAIGQIDRS